ncbi:MAG: SRPBCC family protein [Chloroflexi bacterium]|nr:SRPBCC family protein [Chloroflexota bacterium]
MRPFLTIAAIAAGAGAAVAGLRRWGSVCAATAEETARPMPGDECVAAPGYAVTRAITIDAQPADIWPWLVQMGNGRGGLYSYDFLDRLFGFLDGPSSDRILPEFQHLEAGDTIPIGKGADFPVYAVEDGRSLVLGGSEGMQWTWQMALYPQRNGTTRFVSRNLGALPPGWRSRFTLLGLRPAAFIMTRRWLIGVKQRAERHAAEREVDLEAELAGFYQPDTADIAG